MIVICLQIYVYMVEQSCMTDFKRTTANSRDSVHHLTPTAVNRAVKTQLKGSCCTASLWQFDDSVSKIFQIRPQEIVSTCEKRCRVSYVSFKSHKIEFVAMLLVSLWIIQTHLTQLDGLQWNFVKLSTFHV